MKAHWLLGSAPPLPRAVADHDVNGTGLAPPHNCECVRHKAGSYDRLRWSGAKLLDDDPTLFDIDGDVCGSYSLVIFQMKQPNLSIILPVHNEVDSVERVVFEWDASLRKIPDLHHVFIICEDGSTDGTKELIIELERRYSIVNNSVPCRRGYGQAVCDGIRLSDTDYVLCIDSDGQIGPDQINEVWTRRSEDQFLIGWRLRGWIH